MRPRIQPLDEGTIDLHAPRATYLYRAYGEGQNLLYVGVSDQLAVRLDQHRQSSPWYPLAATVEWETYADRAVALRLEAELIQGLRPPYNTVHNRETREERLVRLQIMREGFSPMDRLLRR